MNSKEILEKIRELSNEEKRKLNYEKLKEIMEYMTADEIIELSNIIGYPVFTRLCMGVLQHKFVLLQDGAAAIIINNEGKILLQSRADRDLWGLPGGCQELGESFKETIIREIKEETNLDIANPKLFDIKANVHMVYPNKDEVYYTDVVYIINEFWGELKPDGESTELKFFDLNNLPENIMPTQIGYIERFIKEKE